MQEVTCILRKFKKCFWARQVWSLCDIGFYNLLSRPFMNTSSGQKFALNLYLIHTERAALRDPELSGKLHKNRLCEFLFDEFLAFHCQHR